MAYLSESAIFQWEDGWRALQGLGEDPRERRRAQAVVDAVRDQLRLRIGPTFTLAELADLYGQGTDWSLAVAMEVAPGIDARPLADAAFWLHRRGATDFGGGGTPSE